MPVSGQCTVPVAGIPTGRTYYTSVDCLRSWSAFTELSRMPIERFP